MTIPSKVAGSGNISTAQDVFRVLFSLATSDAPVLEAWDDFSYNTTTSEVFGITANGDVPMLMAVGTTDGAPVSDWRTAIGSPAAPQVTSPGLLSGDDFKVPLSAALIGAGAYAYFNLNWYVNAGCAIPSDMAAVIVMRFNYTGGAPVLTWEFNDIDAGGVTGVPVWTAFTAGALGNTIKPADASSSNPPILHKPVSGNVDCGEVWVVT